MLEKFIIKTKIIGYFILFVLSAALLFSVMPLSLLSWYFFDYNLYDKIDENTAYWCWRRSQSLIMKLK